MDRLFKTVIILILPSFGLIWASGTWVDSANLNMPRAGATAVTWNGKIFLFGGKSNNNKVLNTVELFDSRTNSWDTTTVEPFEHARYNASAIVWQNKIYLTGGRNNDDVLDKVEIYDPVQNTWGEAHELREEREGHSVSVFNGRIFSIGGQKDNFHLVDDIEWFDHVEEQWEEAEFEMEYPRAAHFAEVYKNEFYMFGGYFYGLTKTIYKAVPDSDSTWVSMGNLVEPRAYGATARIDSLIYIIGGETASGKTSRVEVFNAETGEVSSAEDMVMAHSGMAAAVLNGKIYVIGGYEGIDNDIVDHVHIYDTVTGIEDNSLQQPTDFLFAKAYPNPFNGNVKIELKVQLSEQVQIEILNVLGQKVRSLENTKLNPGKYSLQWDAKDNSGSYVPSGLYFVLIKTQTQPQVLKITYVK